MKKIVSIVVAFCLFTAIILGVNAALLKKSGLLDRIVNKISEITYNDEALEVLDEISGKTLHYYNSLDENRQMNYRRLYKAFLNFEPTCNLNVDSENFESVFYAVLYDNPEIFWVSGSYQYIDYESYSILYLSYTMTKEEAEPLTSKINLEIGKIIDAASNLSTDFEKEVYFHDYICDVCTYDDSTIGKTGGTVYSVLLDGKSVCEGYSRAMQILLDTAGIKNYVVTGDATSDDKTESHMWNIVTLDGENYHLDVTWDDTGSDKELTYIYFNITDSEILLDHNALMPTENNCTATQYNYYRVTGKFVTDFKSFDQLVQESVDTLNSGKLYSEFRFENKSDYKKAVKIIENDDGFFNYIEKVGKKTDKKINVNKIEYYKNENYNYLCIIFVKD